MVTTLKQGKGRFSLGENTSKPTLLTKPPLILLGVQDTTHKKNGLYIFNDRIDSTEYQNIPSDFLKDPQKSPIERETPRAFCVDKKNVFVLTKNYLWSLYHDTTTQNFKEISSRKLRDYFPIQELSAEDSTDDILKIFSIIGTDNFSGSMVLDSDRNLYVGLYAADTSKKVLSSECRLLKLPRGILNGQDAMQFRIIPDVSPTGSMFFYGDELLVPSVDKIQCLENDIFKKFYPSQETSGKNVLAMSVLEDILLATDVTGGYFIEKAGRPYARLEDLGFAYLDRHEQRTYLPMEAMSAAVVKFNEKYYTLFGSDDSKIFIYGLDVSSRTVNPTYLKTVAFFSCEKAREAGSNVIMNLSYDAQSDYVSFTLRNLFIRVGMGELLGQKGRISADIEEDRTIKQKKGIPENEMDEMIQKDMTQYISNLKTFYNLDCVYAVPHRITSWVQYRGVE